MERILVLGVGNAQVDFIKYCRDFGFEVFACSYRHEGRGIKYANHFEIIDIKDIEGVKKFVSRNNIDYIYSVGSDVAMPVVSEISSLLKNQNFMQNNTAIICNNKTKLRDTLQNLKSGIYNVAYTHIVSVDDVETWDVFPAMVKPVDSQGQRGITKVENKEELKNAVKTAIAYSPSCRGIIEEFVAGFEISVNTYLLNGNPVFYFLTERISFDNYPGGIIKKHLYPVTKKIPESAIKDLVCDTARHLGIINGPAYYQLKITPKKQVKVIEITPRFDGCHLWHLIKQMGGPDLFKIVLNHIRGIEPSKNDFIDLPKNIVSELEFFTCPSHQIMNREAYKVSDKAIYVEWYYENGELTRPINTFQEKVGYQICIDR
ncbi:MAG TPA: ATP-grasp domain-containing protein [Bacteroidales bacterium]|nr:ATP-grasp domain-containing protein [Bacteroidales bacterium]HQL70026.1 ATP-grasp domain-containing protein [Bacteroidales bacterium]